MSFADRGDVKLSPHSRLSSPPSHLRAPSHAPHAIMPAPPPQQQHVTFHNQTHMAPMAGHAAHNNNSSSGNSVRPPHTRNPSLAADRSLAATTTTTGAINSSAQTPAAASNHNNSSSNSNNNNNNNTNTTTSPNVPLISVKTRRKWYFSSDEELDPGRDRFVEPLQLSPTEQAMEEVYKTVHAPCVGEVRTMPKQKICIKPPQMPQHAHSPLTSPSYDVLSHAQQPAAQQYFPALPPRSPFAPSVKQPPPFSARNQPGKIVQIREGFVIRKKPHINDEKMSDHKPHPPHNNNMLQYDEKDASHPIHTPSHYQQYHFMPSPSHFSAHPAPHPYTPTPAIISSSASASASASASSSASPAASSFQRTAPLPSLSFAATPITPQQQQQHQQHSGNMQFPPIHSASRPRLIITDSSLSSPKSSFAHTHLSSSSSLLSQQSSHAALPPASPLASSSSSSSSSAMPRSSSIYNLRSPPPPKEVVVSVVQPVDEQQEQEKHHGASSSQDESKDASEPLDTLSYDSPSSHLFSSWLSSSSFSSSSSSSSLPHFSASVSGPALLQLCVALAPPPPSGAVFIELAVWDRRTRQWSPFGATEMLQAHTVLEDDLMSFTHLFSLPMPSYDGPYLLASLYSCASPATPPQLVARAVVDTSALAAAIKSSSSSSSSSSNSANSTNHLSSSSSSSSSSSPSSLVHTTWTTVPFTSPLPGALPRLLLHSLLLGQLLAPIVMDLRYLPLSAAAAGTEIVIVLERYCALLDRFIVVSVSSAETVGGGAAQYKRGLLLPRFTLHDAPLLISAISITRGHVASFPLFVSGSIDKHGEMVGWKGDNMSCLLSYDLRVYDEMRDRALMSAQKYCDEQHGQSLIYNNMQVHTLSPLSSTRHVDVFLPDDALLQAGYAQLHTNSANASVPQHHHDLYARMLPPPSPPLPPRPKTATHIAGSKLLQIIARKPVDPLVQQEEKRKKAAEAERQRLQAQQQLLQQQQRSPAQPTGLIAPQPQSSAQQQYPLAHTPFISPLHSINNTPSSSPPLSRGHTPQPFRHDANGEAAAALTSGHTPLPQHTIAEQRHMLATQSRPVSSKPSRTRPASGVAAAPSSTFYSLLKLHDVMSYSVSEDEAARHQDSILAIAPLATIALLLHGFVLLGRRFNSVDELEQELRRCTSSQPHARLSLKAANIVVNALLRSKIWRNKHAVNKSVIRHTASHGEYVIESLVLFILRGLRRAGKPISADGDTDVEIVLHTLERVEHAYLGRAENMQDVYQYVVAMLEEEENRAEL